MRMHLRAAIVAALAAAALPTTASAQTGAVQTGATQPGPGWSALKSYTGTIVQIDPAARVRYHGLKGRLLGQADLA